MEEKERLQEISERFRRMTAKVKLIKLIGKAKHEYESYDFESGIESLKEAYNIDSKNPVVLRGLGCFQQAAGNYDKAIEYYLEAVKYSSAKEIEYTLAGTAFYIQDKLDDAIKYFNLAIDANDDYERAYEGRNQAMLENHIKILDLQEALKKYF